MKDEREIPQDTYVTITIQFTDKTTFRYDFYYVTGVIHESHSLRFEIKIVLKVDPDS